MDKFGMHPSSGNNNNPLQFENHLEKLKEPARSIMLDLRNFVKSLGANVIEEVRPHRVVYAKTLTFRTFLDIRPEITSLLISIRSGRNAEPVTARVATIEECEGIKKQIAEAYQKIQ